jgi:phosphate transport system protein
MPRQTFDRQIHHLQDEVLLLGSMVEQALLQSVDLLKRRDTAASQRLIRDDHLINEKRYAIENNVLLLMATQQPIAHDLRLLAALLEVTTELERIGDYAKGIAKVTILLEETDLPIPIRELSRMAELATDMLHRALSALVTDNVAVAHAIPAEDSQVDELYLTVYRALVKTMVSSPQLIDQANLLLWVDHNLERTADRVTNICERTIFTATGEMVEMDAEDNEDEDVIA